MATHQLPNYAEDGSLLGEYPMEANPATAPTKGAQHIWLPTANGPMPIAVVGEGRQYAVHADHLNTPRRLTQEDGKVACAWQWAYSAFGEEAPTTAATRFTSATTNPTTGSTAVPLVQYNLRYPGQYFDEESGLHYKHFRSYDPKNGGRYTQADPIGLHGGFNRFAYVGGSPLSEVDPRGLDNPGMGPYSPNDPPSDAFLCSGVLETYPHMWLCAGGSCSGYYGDIHGGSAAFNILAQITTGTTGSWQKNPYKPDLCKKLEIPKYCDAQKYSKCISDTTKEGGTGWYHAAFSNCAVKSKNVIEQCAVQACIGGNNATCIHHFSFVFWIRTFFASDVFCFYAQLPNISQYFYVPIYYEIILEFFCILASLVFAVSHKQKIFGFWLFYFLLSGFFLDFRISRCVQNLEMEVLKYINKGEAHLGVVENESNIEFPANCYIEKSIALEIWRRVDFHIKCSDGNFLTISSYLNEGLPARTFVR